jgi:NADH-quinone oxidoreductase subunit G
MSAELVTLTIDGVKVTVPKGTNLIEAAKKVGTEVPYYCYHPDLSIAGNCRMCQVQVEGMPKLTIGCNTGATEGMVVRTQKTSEEVAKAQRATLEFLLINHPLDCTVCDQAGHCKLQDYYYEYNKTASRFTENKEDKVKAEVLGEEVIYDGERCIVCTRCVRFCDEITETSELGVFNRGDKSVIGIHPGKELNNPLSGTVVDLCPVGALTHRKWRFNTRIWNTKEKDSICPGCSTGCNSKVYVRDGKIVQVKARHNEAVNKEWMCDEGRYGFERFQPTHRLLSAVTREDGKATQIDLNSAYQKLAKEINSSSGKSTAVFLSPFLTLEEVWVAGEFAEKVLGVEISSGMVAMQLKTRTLTKEEEVLISPDYSPNARAGQILGIGSVSQPNLSDITNSKNWRATLQNSYQALISKVRNGQISRAIFIGQEAVLDSDCDQAFIEGLAKADLSLAISPGSKAYGMNNGHHHHSVEVLAKTLLPSITVNEKSGVMVNADLRLQRLSKLLDAPAGASSEWVHLSKLAKACGKEILSTDVIDDRALFSKMVASLKLLSGITLMDIGLSGLALGSVSNVEQTESQSAGATV